MDILAIRLDSCSLNWVATVGVITFPPDDDDDDDDDDEPVPDVSSTLNNLERKLILELSIKCLASLGNSSLFFSTNVLAL